MSKRTKTDKHSSKTSSSKALAAAKQFDPKDLAPEDRVSGSTCHRSWPYNTGKIDMRDPLVTGSFHIVGVNYSRYENAKAAPVVLEKFHVALCDDITSEVGGGVRADDILLRIAPGAIDNVVLHYNTDTDGSKAPSRSPKLVDAMWRMKVDYCIRARDAQRQQHIAMAMYTALNSEYNMAVKTASSYVRYLDEMADATKVRIVPGPKKDKEKDQLQLQAQQQQQHALSRPGLQSPPRGRGFDPNVARPVAQQEGYADEARGYQAQQHEQHHEQQRNYHHQQQQQQHQQQQQQKQQQKQYVPPPPAPQQREQYQQREQQREQYHQQRPHAQALDVALPGTEPQRSASRGLVPPPLPKRSGSSRTSQATNLSPRRREPHPLSPRVEEKVWAPHADPHLAKYAVGAGGAGGGALPPAAPKEYSSHHHQPLASSAAPSQLGLAHDYQTAAHAHAHAAVAHEAAAIAVTATTMEQRRTPPLRATGGAVCSPCPPCPPCQLPASTLRVPQAPRMAPEPPAAPTPIAVGGGMAGSPLSYTSVMSDIRKDIELEKLENDIRTERMAIHESLQAASQHSQYSSEKTLLGAPHLG